MSSGDLRYQVELTPRARRELEKLPSDVARTAAARLMGLADDARPRQATKLRGAPPRWRLRVGSYRAIYTISDRDRVVLILRVVRRTSNTYEQL